MAINIITRSGSSATATKAETMIGSLRLRSLLVASAVTCESGVASWTDRTRVLDLGQALSAARTTTPMAADSVNGRRTCTDNSIAIKGYVGTEAVQVFATHVPGKRAWSPPIC